MNPTDVARQLPTPAGWSHERFKAICSECGSWLWGTVRGAFNEKAMLSQIVVDAVVGMIPLVGDATAVRDLIAVVIGLVDEPEKRESKLQWMLLVVLLFALIPVIGGVGKGVGRLVIKTAEELSHLSGAARVARLQEVARDIVALLNKLGKGNAERWLLSLDFMRYQAQIVENFDKLMRTLTGALDAITKKLGGLLSESMLHRIAGLKNGIEQIKQLAAQQIPQAIKDLNDTLKEIQTWVRNGGETTSRVTGHAAAAGDKAAITYTEELRLMEGAGAIRSARGGWAQNPSVLKEIEKRGLYKHEPGYPNLLERKFEDKKTGKIHYTNITTYAGKIVNRELEEGEQIYRFFGPEGVTHRLKVNGTTASGGPKYAASFWGVGPAPRTAKEWRLHDGAVLDEWNRDGFVLVGTVETGTKIKACTGKLAEQTGNKLPGQYLPAGGKQAMIEMTGDIKTQINALADAVVKDGKPRSASIGGVHWEIRPTGWTDANGIHGYRVELGATGVQTTRLGTRELEERDERQSRVGK